MIRLKKIMVPTDFSEFSEHAFRYGCEFAGKFGAELHLVHVVEDTFTVITEPASMIATGADILENLTQIAVKTLDRFVAPADSGVAVIKRHVLVGVAHLEIARFAKEQEIDLLVITTHGRSGLAHVLMGSVSEKIVRKAPCPVLTVRPEGQCFLDESPDGGYSSVP